MSQFLIHISIGPVQSFIEQARKTQDLFAGSALITRLRETAMANLIQNIDKDPDITLEFITPYVSNNRDFLNDYGDPEKQQAKPLQHLNKLEAILNIPISGLETVLNSAKTKIFKEWVSFAEGICKQWGINYDKFCDQIEQLLEVNILANEISDVGDGYAVAYAQQLTALAAIKRSRSFIQNQQNSEAGKKCHVDNTWNIRIYRLNEGETTSYAQAKLFADNKITFITREDSVKVWHLGFGEGLSAISAVKRMVLNKPHEYPSTAKVALWNTLHTLDRGGHLKPMEDILSGMYHSNDQLFYRENVNEAYFNKYGIFIKEVRQHKCEAINTELTTLYAVAKKQNLSITKYYGVFKFDGDNSNKWLSGEWIDKKFKLEDFHKAYSYAQYNFVVDLMKKLDQPIGKVVYAGEDFLVFFNLEHFTEVLDMVGASYKEHINSKLEHYRSQQTASTSFTFSGGIVISHYKEPLQFVLDSVREMEKMAKNKGKNMLGLRVLNSSGGSTAVVAPWTNKPAVSLVQIMNNTLDSLNADIVSSNFLRSLFEQYRFFRNAIPTELVRPMYERAVKRSYNSLKINAESNNALFGRFGFDGAGFEDEKKLNEAFQLHMMGLYNESADYFSWQQSDMLNFFYIMDFIHRKTHEQPN